MTETVNVLMYYPNTRDDDISSLGKSTSYHKKLDAPGTKPDKTCDVPDSKGTTVTDAKCAADKKSFSVAQN